MITMFLNYIEMLKAQIGHEEGQDLIEYALIIVLFVLLAVVGLSTLAPAVSALWESIAGQLSA